MFPIYDLGRIDFLTALNFQKDIFLKVKNKIISSAIILCEHLPVITLGRLSTDEDLIFKEEIKKSNIGIFKIDRGGKTTYHGPGQLVIYFIFDLNFFHKDLHRFLEWLEELGVLFLDKFGISANLYKGLRGVWIENKKIISIGIGVKNWITYHGMSINIKNEVLENFSLIKPCGLDVEMTSLEEVLKREVSLSEAKEKFLSCIKKGEFYGKSNFARIG